MKKNQIVLCVCFKDLQRGLNKLTDRLMLGHLSDGSTGAVEAVKVEDLMLQVDTIVENISADDGKVDSFSIIVLALKRLFFVFL